MQTADPAAPSDSSWKIYAKAPGIYARSSNSVVGPFGSSGLVGSMTHQNTGSAYTTSSTSFADIDATNLSITITTGAHRAKVTFQADFNHGSLASLMQLDVLLDGVRQGDTTNGLATYRPNNNGDSYICYVFVTSTALSAASHTFKLQWRVDSNTASLFRSALPMQYTVEELAF